MAKAGAAHHREPLSGHRAKTPLANFGHTLREAPLHGQKGPPLTGHLPPDRLPTGEANLWPLATHHRVPLWPKRGGGPSPTGHLRPPPPHWPEKGTATHREKGTPTPHWPPTGHPGRPHWPPTGHKGAAIGGRPSHRPTLVTYRPQWDGMGRLRPALPRLAT